MIKTTKKVIGIAIVAVILIAFISAATAHALVWDFFHDMSVLLGVHHIAKPTLKP